MKMRDLLIALFIGIGVFAGWLLIIELGKIVYFIL